MTAVNSLLHKYFFLLTKRCYYATPRSLCRHTSALSGHAGELPTGEGQRQTASGGEDRLCPQSPARFRLLHWDQRQHLQQHSAHFLATAETVFCGHYLRLAAQCPAERRVEAQGGRRSDRQPKWGKAGQMHLHAVQGKAEGGARELCPLAAQPR